MGIPIKKILKKGAGLVKDTVIPRPISKVASVLENQIKKKDKSFDLVTELKETKNEFLNEFKKLNSILEKLVKK